MNEQDKTHHTAVTILRWGLAFVLVYGAFTALVHARAWMIYIPVYLQDLFAENARAMLAAVAAFQLFLAGWLFWGKRLAWAAGVTCAAFLTTVVANFMQFDLVFREVGLALAALALFVLAYRSE